MKMYKITKERTKDSYSCETKDSYSREFFLIHHRKWYWPFWIWIGERFATLEEAKGYVKQHKAGFVVEYL